MTGSNSTKPRLDTVTPRLPVQDIDEALSFYRDGLGFELGWKWGNPVTHASVCRDSISLDLITVPHGKQGTATVYVQVNGVDAFYSELKGRNVHSSNLDDRP